LFVLLSFSESTKKAVLYLLENQSSAGRPQAGAAGLVQTEYSGFSFPLSRWYFLADFMELQRGRRAKAPFVGCENPATFALEAEFAAVRYFFFACSAVPFATFAVKSSLWQRRKNVHQVKCPFDRGMA
jgi:hypothetical protein